MRQAMLRVTLTLTLIALVGSSAATQEPLHGISSARDVEAVLGTRAQAELMQRLLSKKVSTVLPEVMRRAEADMWIVRNTDGPTYLSLLPADADGHVADWTPFIVLHDGGPSAGVENIGARFDDLAEIVQRRDPDKIVISDRFDPDHRAELARRIGPPYADRLTASPDLATWWLETRTPEEISVFRHVVGVAHDVIGEGYSNRVVVPDVTTTNDLNWWIRQRYADLGVDTDDHPTITVQRRQAERAKYGDPDEYFRIDTSPRNGMDIIIRRGDLLFNDTGIRYLGINTDTQQAAYVLLPGETDASDGLKEAMRHLNRLQDIIGEEMRHGRTGREIGIAASARARQEGIRPRIYSHPISYWSLRYQLNGGFFTRDHYFAGTAITDEPPDEGDDDVETGPRYDLRGPPFHARLTSADHPLVYDTVYALEIDIEHAIPEWDGQDIRLHSETVTAFTRDGMVYPGRSTNRVVSDPLTTRDEETPRPGARLMSNVTTDNEHDELRGLLLGRREAIQAATRTNDAATAVVQLDQARIGRLSRMDAMQSRAMSVELKRRHEAELAAIEAALTRMDGDRYGDCLRCDEPISLARLRASPIATLCIDCAARGGR